MTSCVVRLGLGVGDAMAGLRSEHRSTNIPSEPVSMTRFVPSAEQRSHVL